MKAGKKQPKQWRYKNWGKHHQKTPKKGKIIIGISDAFLL
jgi:hypothetical protein